MNAKGSSNRGIVVGVLASLACVAVGTWWYMSQPAVDSSRVKELLSRKSVGLAVLENSDQPSTPPPSEAFEDLEAISAAFPEELFGTQNLVVARLMHISAFDRNNAQRWQSEIEQTQNALARLKDIAPNNPDYYILAGRFDLLLDDRAGAVEKFQTAAELLDGLDAAAAWYSIFDATNRMGDDAMQAQADAAIKKAHELAPSNRLVALQWMLVQATNKDPAIVDTLQHLQPLIVQHEEEIQKRFKKSLTKFLTDASAAAQAGDWRTVALSTRFTYNLMLNRMKTDRTRIDRHYLEYVVLDFSDEFYERYQVIDDTIPPAIPVTFDAVPLAGLPKQSNVLDTAALDFNLNRSLDLALLYAERFAILSRDDADQWQATAELAVASGTKGILTADLDWDADSSLIEEGTLQQSADPDVVLYGESGIVVLENRLEDDSTRSLKVVDQESRLSDIKDVQFATLGDFDADGDLDVFVSMKDRITCLVNLDGLRFEPWHPTAIADAEGLTIDDAVSVDWDRDLDLDLVVPANDTHPAGILENLQHGRMSWRPFDESYGDAREATSLEVIDADSNASWDLVAATPKGIVYVSTTTPLAGRVAVRDVGVVDTSTTKRVQCFDYDNDGIQDLLAYDGAESTLRRGLRGGKYAEESEEVEGVSGGFDAVRPIDINADGGVDLLIAKDGDLRLLSNNGGNANNWMSISLVAQQVRGEDPETSGRVNHFGLGSLLEVRAGVNYQPLVVRNPATHIGLGQGTSADVVRVVWTNGIPQNIVQPKPNLAVSELQFPKGSCPYLYAWDGGQFVFVTDCLWAAPIGLQTPTGETMQGRPWEWLRISSEQLQPIDGEYRIQITEELWEAAYLEQVELIAVDHPADVDIYTNEKVGPPQLAEPKLHQVRERLLPAQMTDSQGRDVRDWLENEDGRYLKGYTNRIRQGYTDEHFIELDLSNVPEHETLTLFLTGWLFPTDTSINIQLSQNPSLPGPRFPYLMVPDGDGGWTIACDFIGFPGGKTKTIAVDISGVLVADDSRIRICTSAEIYWDAVFCTIDPPEEPLVQQPLALVGADLHYRGVSARVTALNNGPHGYDYNDVQTTPSWPPMTGKLTRYGDVTDLIRDADDRLVVLGSGDEVTLRFAAPKEPLKAGWRRDFILHNVGWDKDADLNTLHGQSIEPLPFTSMSAYPIPPNESPQNPNRYREYLREYQTREQSFGRFKNQIRDWQRSPLR